MTWPSPPGEGLSPASPPESPPQTPWRPAPGPGRPVGESGAPQAETGADTPGASVPPARRTKAGRGRVVPVVVGSVGVLALAGAAWIAVDRDLLPGAGASAGSTVQRLADVTEKPSEAWTYNYLPRGSGDYVSSVHVAGSDAVVLWGPSGYSETPTDDGWTLALVDLDSGEEEWSVPVSVPMIEPGATPEVSLTGVFDDRVLVRAVGSWYDDATGTFSGSTDLVSIARADGAELWRSETDTADTYPMAYAVGRPPAMLLVDDRDVTRVDPRDPEGDPLWTAPHPFSTEKPSVWSVGDGFVRVTDYEGDAIILDLETGEEPEWFDDAAPELDYQVVGGQIYRTETGTRGSYLERLEDDGSVMWSADADSFSVKDAGREGVVVFALERARMSEDSDSGYEYVQRLDPRSGEEMWDEGLETEFMTLESVVDDVVELYTAAGTSGLYSLRDGERVARLRVDPHWTGSTTLYALQEGRLEAYSTAGDRLWSARVPDGTSILSAPGYLVTDDRPAGRLTRWE